LVVLAAGRVQLAGDVADLLAEHYRLPAGQADPARLPAGAVIIHADDSAREATVVVRSTEPIPGAAHADLEDVGLAYMTRAAIAAVRGTEALR
ncbi:MAG: ABC transporter ATP-binding protein, partial [Hamadaea sp.]|nr:ABC transporter ATP-binding protein [Hamadaea sp.]